MTEVMDVITEMVNRPHFRSALSVHVRTKILFHNYCNVTTKRSLNVQNNESTPTVLFIDVIGHFWVMSKKSVHVIRRYNSLTAARFRHHAGNFLSWNTVHHVKGERGEEEWGGDRNISGNGWCTDVRNVDCRRVAHWINNAASNGWKMCTIFIHLAFSCRPIFIFQDESCFYMSVTHTHTMNSAWGKLR